VLEPALQLRELELEELVVCLKARNHRHQVFQIATGEEIHAIFAPSARWGRR